MALGTRCLPIKTIMKDIMSGESLRVYLFYKSKEREFMFGLMENSMMDSGLRGKSMDLEYGKVQKVIAIWENGRMEVLMVMGFTFG